MHNPKFYDHSKESVDITGKTVFWLTALAAVVLMAGFYLGFR